MTNKIEGDRERSVRMREQRRRETALCDLHRDIPEMIHPRRERERNLSDDLSPHMQCCIGVLPGRQRQSGPAGLVFHLKSMLSNVAAGFSRRYIILNLCTNLPIFLCWAWDLSL